MKKRKYILIEWYNRLDEGDKSSTTYELFEDIDKAFKFAKEVKVKIIDLVKANNIYYEEDGKLNYEDFSNTIEEGIISDIY